MTTPRAKAIEIARKLSTRTTTNGCTEDEAESAMRLLQKLMLEHGLNEDELRAPTVKCGPGELVVLEESYLDWRRVVGPIMALCHTQAFSHQTREDALGLGFAVPIVKLTFFGFPLDVQASISLVEICVSAINTQATMYGEGLPTRNKAQRAAKPTAIQSFRIGMAQRLAERIMSIVPRPASGTTGTNLIVLKDKVVNEQYAAWLRLAGHNLNYNIGYNQAVDSHAAAAGARRADRVGLGYERGLATTQRQIGRG